MGRFLGLFTVAVVAILSSPTWAQGNDAFLPSGTIGTAIRPNDPTPGLTRQRSDSALRVRPAIRAETPEDVVEIQEALSRLGFDAGSPDGLLGPRTQRAISEFQTSLGEDATGILTPHQISRLLQILPRATATSVATQNAMVPMAGDIRASRIFAGPQDYPPSRFAAYGILAFKTRASSHDRARHMMICEAYISSIRPFDEIPLPVGSQMATVWPVVTSHAAAWLTHADEQNLCVRAVDEYDNVTADRALRHAALAGSDLSGLGPYLLAWSPSTKKGAQDAIVLIADLSEVHDYQSSLNVMLSWVQDIERDPSLWIRGWTLEKLRVTAQRWFDRRGTQILHIVGG